MAKLQTKLDMASGCPRSDIFSVYKMNGEMFDFFD